MRINCCSENDRFRYIAATHTLANPRVQPDALVKPRLKSAPGRFVYRVASPTVRSPFGERARARRGARSLRHQVLFDELRDEEEVDLFVGGVHHGGPDPVHVLVAEGLHAGEVPYTALFAALLGVEEEIGR